MKYIMMTMVCMMWWSSSHAGSLNEETVSFGSFGDVHLYHTDNSPSLLVLFVSGDGGWNSGAEIIARALASTTRALVAGVDITDYLKSIKEMKDKCVYPPAHFESLSQFLQQQYSFADNLPPVLVGYASGATMVYAILAQSSPDMFLGGISLGFCPSMSLPKPLCNGSAGLTWGMEKSQPGTYIFNPIAHLTSPWVVLQGSRDPICLPDKAKAYVDKVENASIILLPKVGHDYSVPQQWMPRFKAVFEDMTAVSGVKQTEKPNEKEALRDLPLVELPVAGNGDRLAIIVTGDGGWAGIDKSLGEALNRNGIPVVGLNALKYFWKRKTPEQSAADLGRMIRYYTAKWHRNHIILIGYSRGADVVPFMVNRLEDDTRSLIQEIVVMAPQPAVDFQFHVTDWLSSGRHDTELPVLPEIQKLENRNVMCIYGSDEKEMSLCPELDQNRFRVVELPGGHHFGGNYDELARIIMEHVK